jgi:hypothetical protein
VTLHTKYQSLVLQSSIQEREKRRAGNALSRFLTQKHEYALGLRKERTSDSFYASLVEGMHFGIDFDFEELHSNKSEASVPLMRYF